jgi:hypothetical protein
MAGGTSTYTLPLDNSYNAVHPGKTVYLKLKDATGATTIGGPVSGVIGGNGVTLSIPNIVMVTGTMYRADFFVDLVGNGQYAAPPTDHSWRIMVPGNSAGVTNAPYAHNLNFTDLTPF